MPIYANTENQTCHSICQIENAASHFIPFPHVKYVKTG